MFDKLPYNISCCICTFLGIRDHESMAECNRIMNKIAKDPTSVTYEIMHTNILRRLMYHPRNIRAENPINFPKCESVTRVVMWNDVKGIANLVNLEYLVINDNLLESLTSLTKLTHIACGITRSYNEFPPTIKSMKIYGSNSVPNLVRDISRFPIENLEFRSPQIPDLSVLKLNSLTIFNRGFTDISQMNIPTLQELTLDIPNWHDALRSIKIGPMTIININILDIQGDTDLLRDIPKTSRLTICTNQPGIYLSFNILKNIVSLRTGTSRFLNVSILMQMPNLKCLRISSNDTEDKNAITIACGSAKFYYWPNLSDIYIRKSLSLVFDLLYLLHNSPQPINNERACKAPYYVNPSECLAHTIREYINKYGMQSSF